ncbi:zinc finger CCCH domain-containing protein 16 isoform X3 [Gossypium hirsutum]|uniref:Zinc finger CCCH domain-containing protein 16 isoform X3 n=1 Tax=Gossypium hirsutum TaxID=3635 RepID=A0A1U8J705_GOSHI|nr:zinc finger CCCH domain-containing protein 16 isoform X3 [Gossypium hirsutum]
MHNKKEACRNFQRGSCQYGERCKFLHVIQQQPKSNAFGFGTQAISHQQQKPNPFGFGVQNNAQSKGVNDFGNKQSQFKNTWTRSSASSGAPSLRQPDNQPQATNHRCNDPESCKRIIAEDFEHERPLWKLTCYSHWKNSPCDIVGDVSYEELRAAAYDDAKRDLLALLRHNKFHFREPLQLSFLPLLKILSLLKAMSLRQSPVLVSWELHLIQDSHRGLLYSQIMPLGNQLLSQIQPNLQMYFQQTMFHRPMPQPNQSVVASFPTNMANFSNSSATNPAINQFSAAAISTQNFSSSSIQSPAFLNVSLSNSEVVGREATNVQLGNNLPTTVASGDSNIWLKEKWTPGEIPEEAPPDAYV